MENRGSLTEKSVNLILALLKEPKIFDRVTAPVKNRERYKNIVIVAETGTIMLGKYSWSSYVGTFWNNLIKCKKDISFEEFALRTWDALVDMTAGTKAGQAVLEGLGRETLMEGIRNKNWDWLIDRFFDINRHLTKGEYWSTTDVSVGNKSKHHEVIQTPNDEEVVITVADRQPKRFKVVDAIGDVFEIIDTHWVGGKKRC